MNVSCCIKYLLSVVDKGRRGGGGPWRHFYWGGTMSYVVGQGLGTFLAKEAMKLTYFLLYLRENHIIFFNN